MTGTSASVSGEAIGANSACVCSSSSSSSSGPSQLVPPGRLSAVTWLVSLGRSAPPPQRSSTCSPPSISTSPSGAELVSGASSSQSSSSSSKPSAGAVDEASRFGRGLASASTSTATASVGGTSVSKLSNKSSPGRPGPSSAGPSGVTASMGPSLPLWAAAGPVAKKSCSRVFDHPGPDSEPTVGDSSAALSKSGTAAAGAGVSTASSNAISSKYISSPMSSSSASSSRKVSRLSSASFAFFRFFFFFFGGAFFFPKPRAPRSPLASSFFFLRRFFGAAPPSAVGRFFRRLGAFSGVGMALSPGGIDAVDRRPSRLISWDAFPFSPSAGMSVTPARSRAAIRVIVGPAATGTPVSPSSNPLRSSASSDARW